MSVMFEIGSSQRFQQSVFAQLASPLVSVFEDRPVAFEKFLYSNQGVTFHIKSENDTVVARAFYARTNNQDQHDAQPDS